MNVIKIKSSERRTTVELSDREVVIIYAALLETDFKTGGNQVDGRDLWNQFHDLANGLGLGPEGRALYLDAV